jgi:hypothetical protein
MENGGLRPGDVVQVRSATEIMATLDDRGTLAGLPFMPEMVQHCGRTFVVAKRAERVCWMSASRRVRDTVILGDLRCDGSGHEGCQEECRLLWNEAWLRRVGSEKPDSRDADDATQLVELVTRNAKQEIRSGDHVGQIYRCQYTELVRASQGLAVWDPRTYLRELTSGNVPFSRFLRVIARAAFEESLHGLGLAVPDVPVRGSRTALIPVPALGLQPGEWVEVRSRREIEATLSPEGKYRGLWFDREMLPFCGKRFRVRQRVSRIIDYQTGRLIELKSDCVKLEGVTCSGDLSLGRWFCPRAIYPYWRECWLRRVDGPGASP